MKQEDLELMRLEEEARKGFSRLPHVEAVNGVMTAQAKRFEQRISELMEDRAKLTAQLDATKKFAHNLYLLAVNSPIPAKIIGETYLDAGDGANFSEEDWYNVDKSSVIPRYLAGEFDDVTGCYLLQVDLMTFRRMAQADQK